MIEDKQTKNNRKVSNMKKIMKNKANNKVGIDNPVITAPLIDKLSGVVHIKDVGYHGQAYYGILSWLETHELGVMKAASSAKYPLAVKLYYTVNNNINYLKGPHLLLQITGKNSANRHIRFECNPSDMTEAGVEYLDGMFFEILGLSFYEFLAHARFTRIDFCRNIWSRDLEDYLLGVKWSKSSQCFFGKDGALETIYFGKSGSNQVYAYNKAKELYGSAATDAMIRIEARCRIKLTLQGLLNFKNPFERVSLYSLACKNPPLGISHWRSFQDCCRMRGIGNAIKRQEVKHRASLKKALSTLPVAWWDIAPEDWEWLLHNALEQAGLLNIPDNPPPLSLQYHVGNAA